MCVTFTLKNYTLNLKNYTLNLKNYTLTLTLSLRERGQSERGLAFLPLLGERAGVRGTLSQIIPQTA